MRGKQQACPFSTDQEVEACSPGVQFSSAVSQFQALQFAQGGLEVDEAAAGEIVLAPEVSRTPSLKGERDSGLTPRELEILQLIVEGNSNKAIADRLSLSANTVAVHRANIMDALGIHKTAELVVYAIRNGLVNIS